MEKSDLEAIAEVVIKHDLFVLSDEIYAELTYLENHVSIASLPGMKERTVLINGFSKSHAMTGLEIGVCVCTRDYYQANVKKFISMPLCVHLQPVSMRQ